MKTILLDSSSRRKILAYLSLPEQAPTLRYLNRLITAYTRSVPWESVSRILKRHTTAGLTACPRWPEEFWEEAMAYGTGGTCFESSLAFYSLLVSLGYQGYLTVNDMDTSRGCHAAIIVVFNGQKYLVDVTIPVHAAVLVDPDHTTRRQTFFHNYTIRPAGANSYQIERSHHSRRNAFTLIDVPVSLAEYRRIVTQDYRETGHFLKQVVIVKVIDRAVWRFNSAENPLELVYYNRAGKVKLGLSPAAAVQTVAGRFHIPADQLARALHYVEHTPQIPLLASCYRVPAFAC